MSGGRRSDTFWQPRPDCGPDCLPPAGAGGVGPVRRALRFAGLLGVLVLGLGLLPVLPLAGAAGRAAVGRRWARGVLRVLGVRLVAGGAGRLPRRGALLVANHTSWLDIVAVLALAPTRMLAKREVRGWPLFGWLAAAGGTIFIDRSRPRALPGTVREVAAALRSGALVTVFPEGTTWCGVPRAGRCGGSGRFRPAMFQAAVEAGAAVVPLALGYRAGDDPRGTTAAAFLGEESLYDSLRRVLAIRDLVVSVGVAPPLYPGPAADRRNLARLAQLATPRPAPPRVRADHGVAVGTNA
ncbi:lysophospholipid acyltransferase family protein [Plantactinospora siamensis]|uniref:Lysophospholipid acyltransferase family protein n=1 Tax=Plantactinospora siamensis TaxID=555372 RepID=A0ABV6NXB7_9ACTN